MSDNKIKIPFADLSRTHVPLKEEFLKELSSIIDTGDFILGHKVAEFESAYAHFSNTKHCIGVGNGLDALKIALRSAGVTKGDKVLVPAHTFSATWLAVADIGAVPVGCDVDKDTFNIDVSVTNLLRIKELKAMVPVHIYGSACNMDTIMDFAQNANCVVVEDNAQAQGALYKQKATGSFGIANATSFYPGKNVGAMGDAGAITTNSDEILDKARSLRNYGSLKKYEHNELGYNSRLDTMQAALLQVKLKQVELWNEERNKLAARYRQNLSAIEQIKFQRVPDNSTSVYHIMAILINQRQALQQHLFSYGIQTIIHYPTQPHLQSAFAYLGYTKGSFPVAELIAEQTLSLPLFAGMTEDEVDEVSDRVIQFFR